MELNPTFSLGLIVFLGIFSQWFAWKISRPAIVVMSIAGLLLGPILQIVVPANVLGDDIYKAFVSMAVALILFEGSLSLNVKEIRGLKQTIKRIVFIGAFLAWILGSLCAYFLTDLSLTSSVVIGSILIVTGPTVILPLLRQAQLDRKVATILKWEGILVDPMGAILAVFAFELANTFTQDHGLGNLLHFGVGVLAAIVLGLAIGYLSGKALAHQVFPEYLKAPIMLSLVLGVFLLSELIAHETGLLAVTIMGVILGNMPLREIEELKHFNENISVLLTSSVFIMLTASLSREVLVSVFKPSILLFVLAMLFIVRPLSIWISTIGTETTIKERALLGWIAPRGIVALTVTGYFTEKLIAAGYQDAELLLALTFALVIVTVIVHGFSIRPLALKLGLAHAGKPGVVIVGSNPFSIALSEFLESEEIPVLIVDSKEEHLSHDLRQGVEYHQGEILYEVSNYNLDLVIYDKLFLNSPIPLYNIMVSNEFMGRFGRDNICMVSVLGDKSREVFKEIKHLHIPRLGDYRATYLNLIACIYEGYGFSKVKIDADMTVENYFLQMDQRRINLFTLDTEGNLEFFTVNHHENIKEGDWIVSLAPPDKVDQGNAEMSQLHNKNWQHLEDDEATQLLHFLDGHKKIDSRG